VKCCHSFPQTLAPATIHARGFGETKPIASNAKPDGSDDPDGRSRNRRVEVVVKK
jgi:photosystem I P700 chlorophyll a apoprotein A2